ncbi:hypothetical protein SYNPS1DRAFT_22734, partial [Syncephalis pseudoplumigaleata]
MGSALKLFFGYLGSLPDYDVNEEDIFNSIKDLFKQCQGGYACVGMIAGFGLIAFRDPN